MNIAVIGGGSIGLLVGYYLSKHHDVTMFVKREKQKQAIQSKYINLYKKPITYKSEKLDVALLKDIHSQFDLYIFCVKQTQLEDILISIAPVIDKRPLLFLQNGMGHIETTQRYEQPIYVGVVSHGAHRVNDYEVNHLGKGSIKIASLTSSNQELDHLIDTLHLNDFPIEKSDNWEKLLKEKLIVNAVINPITALFDVPNGAIIKDRNLRYLANKICEETAVVLQLSEKESWKMIVNTARITEDNVSSMRADIQNNRKTELEAITGYIIKNALIDVSYTSFIYHAILALEERD